VIFRFVLPSECIFVVIAELVPAVHVSAAPKEDVDARDFCANAALRAFARA